MKKLLSVCMAAVMLVSLVACGGSGTASNSVATSTAADTMVATSDDAQAPAEVGTETEEFTEKVTIKFANYAILEAGYEEFWNGVKDGFEKKYSNVTIEYVTAPYGEIVNQVINMAGGGDKVDLIFSEVSWIPSLAEAGLACPVSDVVSEDYLADFYESVLEAHKYDGDLYGLPLYASPFVLYYNKDLFAEAGLDPEAPPTTYEEMLTYAEKLSELKTADGNQVYAFGQTTASVPVSGSSLNAMVYNFGGTVLKEDGTLDTNTPEFKEAFETLKLLDEKGYNPQNAKLKDLRNLFALGQLAMYYDQSWGYNGVNNINPEAANFMASALPLKGGNGTGASIVQSQCLVLADNGEAQKTATRLLIEYMMTEEVVGRYITTITPAYPVMKSLDGMAALAENTVLKGASGCLDNMIACPQVPTLNDINLELASLAQAVTVGGKNFDEAYPTFEKAVKALISN